VIFASVGTQLPFDRLIKALDDWVGEHNEETVFAQIGNSDYKPVNFEYSESLSPSEFQLRFGNARLIVAHAGMGTILQCLDVSKPLIIMPRRSDMGEHRNDHQMATAEKFKRFNNVCVVEDQNQLWEALDKPPVVSVAENPKGNANIDRLINEIHTFINT